MLLTTGIVFAQMFGDYCTRVTYPLSSVWLRWHRPSFGVKIPGGKMQLKTGSFHQQNMKINSQVKQPPMTMGPKARKNKEPASLPSKAQWKSRSVARTIKRRDWGRHLQSLIISFYYMSYFNIISIYNQTCRMSKICQKYQCKNWWI